MKIQIIIAVLLALVGCSKPEDVSAGMATTKDQGGPVSHAKPEQPAQIAPGARPTPTNRPSALDRRLREGAQEKGQGLGRLDRKRGE